MNLNFDENLKLYGEKNNVPITKDDTLNFLIQTIKENDFKQILEIGTAIGYGCISMATYSNCDHIDTLEIDKKTYDIAQGNIKSHDLQDKITGYNIDAFEYIKQCNKMYDFVYLDGPKGQYINYLPYLMKIVRVGGIIFADNLNFHGMVTGLIPVTKGCRSMIKGLHNYINEINSNPCLETKFYKDLGDGVGVSKVIKK